MEGDVLEQVDLGPDPARRAVQREGTEHPGPGRTLLIGGRRTPVIGGVGIGWVAVTAKRTAGVAGPLPRREPGPGLGPARVGEEGVLAGHLTVQAVAGALLVALGRRPEQGAFAEGVRGVGHGNSPFLGSQDSARGSASSCRAMAR
jgi:hypothetical protein